MRNFSKGLKRASAIVVVMLMLTNSMLPAIDTNAATMGNQSTDSLMLTENEDTGQEQLTDTNSGDVKAVTEDAETINEEEKPSSEKKTDTSKENTTSAAQFVGGQIPSLDSDAGGSESSDSGEEVVKSAEEEEGEETAEDEEEITEDEEEIGEDEIVFYSKQGSLLRAVSVPVTHEAIKINYCGPNVYPKYVTIGGEKRVVYCLEQPKPSPNGNYTWDELSPISKYISYLNYFGCNTYYTGSTPSAEWKQSYYATQMAIHMINYDLTGDPQENVAARNNGQNPSVWNRALQLVADAYKYADDYFDDDGFSTFDHSCSITPGSTETWTESGGVWTSSEFNINMSSTQNVTVTEFEVYDGSTKLTYDSGNGVWIEKLGSSVDSNFVVKMRDAKMQEYKASGKELTVKYKYTYRAYSNWRYLPPAGANTQACTFMEMGTIKTPQERQVTLKVPKTVEAIGTSAKDNDTNSRQSIATNNVTIVDTVTYSGLDTSKTYILKGTLMDKSTRQPITVNGAPVTAIQEFKPSAASGSVNVTFVFDASAYQGKALTTVVFEKLYVKGAEADGQEVTTHEDYDDEGQTIEFPASKISTSAKDSESNSHVALPRDQVTIIDTVNYEGLVPGQQYTIKGVLMDKSTGDPLIVNGNQVTAFITFTADSASGSKELTFTFDASALRGKKVVVFERLYYKDREVAVHADINDEGQTVEFPEIAIGTTAKDSETNSQQSVATNQVTIIDTVKYTGLDPKVTYVLKGTLMDKATWEAVEVDGKPVTAEKEFKPGSINGTVDVTFTFDATQFKGQDFEFVVFEVLYEKGKEGLEDDLASHEDMEDQGQTIKLPGIEISTDAKDKETGLDEAKADKEVTIIDVVTYKGLVVGQSYTVKGVLMDKSTNSPLLVDGQEVRAQKTFKAEKSDGTIELEFTFNGSALKGKTVVVFETLYYNDKEVAVHTDIDDSDQTIDFPGIGTTAEDSDTKDHISKADEEVIIIDTVAFTNLKVGKDYVIKGVLMDKSTGDPLLVNGQEVTAQKEFRPTTANGTVTLEFTFDGSAIKDTTVVVYERLYRNNKEIAGHTDINDAAQTIKFPEIETNAADELSGDKKVPASEDVTIVDQVTYSNLLVGKDYTVKGVLMDKSTGKPLLVNGLEIRAEKEFTAETADGSVELAFTFDASALQGTTVVVFETLYYNDKEVAVHADINDKDQTVEIPEIKIGTSALDNETQMQQSVATNEVTLVDTVSYSGLDTRITYVLKGVLMNKATGEPLKINGKVVTAQTEFKPTAMDGTVEVTFVFDATKLQGKDVEVVVFEKLFIKDKEDTDEEIAIHEDLEDEGQKIGFPGIEITTDAKDSETGTEESKADEEITIIDVVSYQGLVVGQNYTVKGVLMDKATGEPLLVDGQEVRAEKTFKAEKSDGTIELEFTFDGSALQGTTIVVFETLYYNGKEAATHADIEDEDQTIYIPGIRTSANDSETKGHVSKADEEVTIIDTVTYTNLQVGKNYVLSGVLMDKATGKPLLVDGSEIRAEKEFTPETPNGKVTLAFTFDGSALKGDSIVVFEKLYRDGKEAAVHEDIEDEKQTIEFPDIETNASDLEDGDEMVPANEEVTIIDIVTYKNLIIGEEYTVKGVLMDKATGEPLLADGQEIRAEKTFIAETRDGTIELEFTFDARALQGTTAVVFEKLYYNDKEVAIHEDIEDKDQTVDIPDVRTNASDLEDGDKVVPANEEVTVVDVVSYKNLVVGREYTVKGILMDKATGEPLLVNGEVITAEKTFIAETRNGTIELEFSFDARALQGTTIVVFEKLFEDEREIAVHEDIDDQDQTVDVPDVSTNARDSETGTKEGTASELVTIIDEVTYTNLAVGKEYTIKGRLMDKTTGEPLLINGEEITAEVTFTAETRDGMIELEFTFDASALKEYTVVVFEKLYEGEREIAVHEDIDDEDQTVIYKNKVSILKIDEVTGEPLAGAVLAVKDPSDHNKVIDTWTSTGEPHDITGLLDPGKIYILSEIIAPEGYRIAQNQEFLPEQGEVIMEDPQIDESDDGEVQVIKITTRKGELFASNLVFYTALFSDAECTTRVTSVKALKMNGAFSTTVSFTNLPYGTYYVAETDEFGEVVEGTDRYSVEITNGEATLTQEITTAKALIDNQYQTKILPEEHVEKYGDIKVTKRVISAATGKEKEVDATFYVALFLDEECEFLIGEAQPLTLKGASSTTITFEGMPAGTYYVAETDANGVPLTGQEDGFDYEIAIDHSAVTIEEANKTYAVTITNAYQGKELSDSDTKPTTTGTYTGTNQAKAKAVAYAGNVKTGDESHMMRYLLLLAIAAGGVIILYRKRRYSRVDKSNTLAGIK